MTNKELLRRIAFLERNLKRQRLATPEQIEEIANRCPGRKKEALYQRWAELRALAVRQATDIAKARDWKKVTQESLQVAVEALRETSVKVNLLDGTELLVCPASFDRIDLIEDRAWWITRLTAAKFMIMTAVNNGEKPKDIQGEICEKCSRPLEPDNLYGLLKDINEELSHQRSWLYAQVTAPTPAPVTVPVDWSERITPAEDRLLLEAYHRVNYDVITRIPEPSSSDGERQLPHSWAFLFAHRADRERRPAVELTCNRSLGSLIANMSLEAIRDQQLRSKGKIDAEKFAEGIG